MAGNLKKLESEILRLQERNARVESDKAWETSSFRKTTIALFTYVFAAITFFLINTPNPMLNAFVPTLAYLLSTISFPHLRNLWASRFRK
ncbi:hypothetical protein HY995_05235 [Candidatus Micrarchaeota archaeon]|nr:hypothetical protein [Candidatus Micrarchaeota archaeon]MBI5177458.1 hypothetical protein [Candidatus Micrarchaeota archaeon]